MNRQQRRQQPKASTVTMSDEILNRPVEVTLFDSSVSKAAQDYQIILYRIRKNLVETGHPMHHKAEDGTIVNLDVSLEHLIKQLKPLPCIPVNRAHYGFEMYSEDGDK
jgi:hypothetical protein